MIKRTQLLAHKESIYTVFPSRQQCFNYICNTALNYEMLQFQECMHTVE